MSIASRHRMPGSSLDRIYMVFNFYKPSTETEARIELCSSPFGSGSILVISLNGIVKSSITVVADGLFQDFHVNL